jgi:hypothetical protein
VWIAIVLLDFSKRQNSYADYRCRGSEYEIAQLTGSLAGKGFQPPSYSGIAFFIVVPKMLLHMKIYSILFALLTILTLQACQTDTRTTTEADNDAGDVNTRQETPVKMIEYLVGDWQREGSGQQATENGGRMQRLTFTEEARYIAYANNQKTDSGAFRMNEQLNNLYLESEANGQALEYEIDLKGDTMTLKLRTPDAGQQNSSYTFRRIGQPSISAEKRGEQ